MDSLPFYQNPTFWSFVASIVAIALSQLPKISFWFKNKKIDFELHNKITVNHWVGIPTLNVFLGLSNKGYSSIKIRSIGLTIIRDGKVLKLKCNSFYESTTSQVANLFFPFELSSSESWDHICWFGIDLERNKEQKLKNTYMAIDMNINDKIRLNGVSNQLVEADEEIVRKLIELKNENFFWETGEYLLEINFETLPFVNVTRKVRFTLFESDIQELSDYSNDYKYGAGYCRQKHMGINVQISEG